MLNMKKIGIDSYFPIEMLYILLFCNDAFASLIGRMIGFGAINTVYAIAFFILLLMSYVLNGRRYQDSAIPVFVYSIVAVLILLTTIIHPEYHEWFSHPLYGVTSAFLNPRWGIWAFLVVWLFKDRKHLFHAMKISAWLLLVFYTLQFIAAKARGYWVSFDVDGALKHSLYNLEFGYNMLYPTAFMGAYGFLNSKKKYYIPYAIGFLTILFGGSRGAIIWPILMFPAMLPFKWRNMNKKQRIRFGVINFLALMCFFVIYMYYDVIFIGLKTLFRSSGLSSRTIDYFFSGTFTDASERHIIANLAIDLIKRGGLFGWGVYGDRYVIGNYYKWGYSHNLFLELFVSFGYLGGFIASFLIIKGVIKLFKHTNEVTSQIIFITFLTTSMKLMLSNSFWYSAAFWSLIVLMMKWNRRKIKRTGFVLHEQGEPIIK